VNWKNEQLMKLLFITLICLINLCAQSQSSREAETTFANFLVEEGVMIWRLVYDRNELGEDSIKRIVYKNIVSDNSMRIIEETSEELIIEMKNKVFEYRGDEFTCRVSIGVKDGKYRVTMTDIRIYHGSKTKTTSVLLGVSESMESLDGLRIEEFFLNKKGEYAKKDPTKGLEIYNNQFKKGFDFKNVSLKNNDW
jgi:CRISPR/Cas system-associated protein endoribonuclease Cas2